MDESQSYTFFKKQYATQNMSAIKIILMNAAIWIIAIHDDKIIIIPKININNRIIIIIFL